MRKLLLLCLVALLFAPSLTAQPYTIQQYLNIRSAGAPTLSPDGTKMAYLTNTSGTSQVWLIDLPNGTPRQLTDYGDNVSFVRWLPDNSGIIFGKARGGDENTQFFWMKTDGSGVRALTEEPKVRHNFAEISKDGTKIYYASNKRNRTFFDVCSMDIATGKEELLYQYDGNISIAAVNDNGTKFVLSRDGVERSLDNDLYMVDVATKKETLLTPHTDASEFGDVHFLADGLVLTTNDKREFSSLAYMRKKNASGDDWSEANRETRVVDDQKWDIGGVTLTDNNSMMAYSVNRDGFSQVYLRKIETGGKPLISTIAVQPLVAMVMPGRGVVSGLKFSKDQTKLAFTFGSPKHNNDIWIYDLRSREITQVTKSDRDGIPQQSFIAPRLIKFKTFDGRDIPAWYYLPRLAPRAKDRVGDKYKTIVSVHGGPEGQERPGFNPLYQYYLSRGYAILATNVRGSTGYGKTYTHLDDVEKREDSVKDLAAAVEWLKTSGYADPEKIAVMGGSYGGYMTMAAITLYPDLWAAVVGTVAITNWETFLQNTSGYRRRQREAEYGRLDRDIDFLRRISPIRKIDRIKTPLFVISGLNDPRVPYRPVPKSCGFSR